MPLNRAEKRCRPLVLAAMLLVPLDTAKSDPPPKEPGPARTVALFRLFCHQQVPNLEKIAHIAERGNFPELKGDELEAYQPDVRAEQLRAWSFNDHGEKIVLTTAKSLPDAQFRKAVPRFADSVNYACSFVIPVAENAEPEIKAEMTRLIGRPHDESWDQPPLRAHAWCGSNETTYACTYFWSPLEPGGTGLLSSTVFVKE